MPNILATSKSSEVRLDGPPSITTFCPFGMLYATSMIEKDIPIKPRMFVRQDDGLHYEVEDVRPSTVDWEVTRELGKSMVNYTQLEDGDYPAGTKYVKDEEGFRKYFTIER